MRPTSTHARIARGFAVSMALAVLLVGAVARAQADAGTPVCLCTTERREIATLQSARQACEAQQSACEAQQNVCDAQRTTCAARLDHANTDLSVTRRELDDATASAASCRNGRDQICTATGGIVADVLQLRSEIPSANACVSDANRRALDEFLSSLRGGRAALQRLETFARGDTNVLAVPSAIARGEMEALALRLAGNTHDAPLVYTRLLVDAVRGLAPHFWASLRTAGRDAVDNWFVSSADLDPAFLEEIEATLTSHVGDSSTGPSQSAALRLVRAYRDLVGCEDEDRPTPRQCGRAAQLQTYLESSTALIVRRRIQEIWGDACDGVDAHTILTWLREFPASQPTLGRAEWNEVTSAGYDKLVACYLADATANDARFPDWLARRLPSPSDVTDRSLHHLDELGRRWSATSPEAQCLTAAHTLRALRTPAECVLPAPARDELRIWFERRRTLEPSESLPLRTCTAYVDALWHGHRARVDATFPGAPSPEEVVQPDRDAAFPATSALRSLCGRRAGSVASFPRNLHNIAAVAAAAGEDVTLTPWQMDAAGSQPIEAAGYAPARAFWTWARQSVTGKGPCAALGLAPSVCQACTPSLAGSRYDCGLVANVDERWRALQRLLVRSLLIFVSVVLALRWGISFVRTLRAVGAWRREMVGHFRGIGLKVDRDPLGIVFPSRMSVIRLALPGGPWERWGTRLAIRHAESAQHVTERDVQGAGMAARAQDGELAIVTHDEGASPSLAAVRSMLDWAARGPRGAVQILAVSSGRLRWARSTDDLLDLIEQVSLRGNPFEVRGRLVSSSQFFNRERLVSGLLAAAQAGAWTVITGLRRFGKSSLALEVARRLQTPYAYVDLAGFHHEVASGVDAPRSVDAILRYVCRQLHASAEALYGRDHPLPEPPNETATMDTVALSSWIRLFLAACRAGKPVRSLAPLVIFDEVEQAIGVGADRVANAVDVLSILVGRLRACFSDALATQGGDRIGVLFCSAIHAALWAPLTTLGGQSLLGAFPSVTVPRLPDDAAFAMMRGLGARQGIRFTEAALTLIVREAQGIPILVRRIGSAVLDLYDPERARQGSLGAVEIGIEGATAAIRREEEDGAPLRVWVESEIGDLHNPVGGILRIIARRGTVPVEELKERFIEATAAQFEQLGRARVLQPDEIRRRSVEAAGFLVRMLGEIGILTPEGDVTHPSAFTFPDSIVRRILASEGSESLLGF